MDTATALGPAFDHLVDHATHLALTWLALATLKWIVLNAEALGGWWWRVQIGYFTRDTDAKAALLAELRARNTG